MKTIAVTLLLPLVLAGCGGPGSAGGAGAWNETDACKTLDKAAVASATGQQVTAAELSSSSPAADGRAAVTMCTYTLANGAYVAFMTRVSHDVELSDAEIEEMRTVGGTQKDTTEVAGIGLHAYWLPGMKQLQVTPDRNRWMSLNYQPAMTLPGAPVPAGPDPKSAMIALARKVST